MDSAAIEIHGLLQSIDRTLKRIADAVDCQSPPEICPSQSYTRKEAARFLRVSVWTVDQARKKGLLTEARKIGKRDVRVTGESLTNFHKSISRATVRVVNI